MDFEELSELRKVLRICNAKTILRENEKREEKEVKMK